MQNVIARFTLTNAAMAYCVPTLVDAARLVCSPKFTGLVMTHRIWVSASPPEEVLPV
ncbi:MAG: hypothetical protein VCB26_00080 [Candidatus Hydrogenedentota bacterium]